MTGILEEELQELHDKNLYRKLRTLTPVDSTHAYLGDSPHPTPLPNRGEGRVRGREILLFCGNDYLGLSHHPRVMTAAKETISHYGVGAGAARLISGTSELHTRLEEKIARLKRKQKALVFTAGYLANLGVLSALAGEKDLILMDKLCHASLIDGARLSGATVRTFPHKNYERCEEILKQSQDPPRRILVSDTVFSMDGDLADLEALIKIKQTHGCLLVVDDAHGTGVLGLEGRGAAEDLNLEEKIDCMTGTFSKALGCLGGFAAASEDMIHYFINFSRPFIFATALPPVVCGAALEALDILQEEPEIRHRLWRNIQKMQDGLKSAGFETGPIASPIFPIILGAEKDALDVSEHLLNQGILVPAVRYPTVSKGKARLRVTVSASHTGQDIQRLMDALTVIKNKK